MGPATKIIPVLLVSANLAGTKRIAPKQTVEKRSTSKVSLLLYQVSYIKWRSAC
jgi:hypothetical protein